MKKISKRTMKILAIVATAIALFFLSSSTYFMNTDDGKKSEDWTNAPFVAEKYNQGLEITQDGYLLSSRSLNKLWEDMVKNQSRITAYLNGPKEYLQMIYAQMVTQLPDLREDTSKIRTLEEWKEVFDALSEEEGEFETFHGSSGGSGDFEQYNLSEEEIRGLTAVALAEQGTVEGAAAEASLMANLYEERGSRYSGIVDYVLKGGWFATTSTSQYSQGTTNEQAVSAVRSVLVDGRRTLPKYVNEHDCKKDIISATNDGVAIDIYDDSAYIQYKTIIKNKYNSTYTFYSFPAEGSDPFGYTSEEARNRYGDDCYGESTSSVKKIGYKTNIQGGIVRFTRNLVSGESTATSDEIKKMEYDYENYKDDYEAKQKEKEKKEKKKQGERKKQEEMNLNDKTQYPDGNPNENKEDEEDEENEEELGPLLEYEEWMKKRGYTKKEDGQWKRAGHQIAMSYVEPKEFDQYINDYKMATNEAERNAAREKAMSHFTLVKGNGGTGSKSNRNVPTLDSMDGVLFIGDSLTYGLQNAVKMPGFKITEEARQVLKNSIFVAQGSTTPEYWLNRIRNSDSRFPNKSEVKAVCIMLGTNDPTQIKEMQELIEELLKKYPGKNIYVQKLLPVGNYEPGAFWLTPDELNAGIRNYNPEMEKYCAEKDGVYFIDATDGYVTEEGTLNPAATTDGVHLYGDFGTWAENIASIITGRTVGSSNCGPGGTAGAAGTVSNSTVELDMDKLKADPDFTNNEAWKAPSNAYAPSFYGQCTWFAWGKFYEVYGFSPGFTENGYECVDQLLATHPDKFEKSDTPVPGSIFSYNNHVGMVVDFDGETMTIQDGNYNASTDPWEVAITDWKTIEHNFNTYKSAHSDITFANPKGVVNSSSGNRSGDSKYNVKIATWEEVTTEYNTQDENDPNGQSIERYTSYRIKTETINYYNMIKAYTMPFDYLWALLTVTEDRGFIFELLRTVYESDIEVMISDKLTDTIVETTNTYNVIEKASASGHAVIRYSENLTEQEKKDGETPVSKTSTVTASYSDKEISNESFVTTSYTNTITNTMSIGLARANVWIVDYTKSYVYNQDVRDYTVESDLQEESTALPLEESDITELGNVALSKVSGTNKKLLNLVVDGGNRTRLKSNRKETVLTTVHVQGYEDGEKSLREKTGKVINADKVKSVTTEIQIKGEVDIFDIDESKYKKTSTEEKDKTLSTDDSKEKKKEDKDKKETKENEEKVTKATKEDKDKKKDDEEEEKNDEEEEKDDDKDENEKEKDKNKNNVTSIENKGGTLITHFVTTDSFIYKEKNFVTLLCTYRNARDVIQSAASWLFEILEENESTVEMVDLTKYLLYKVTDSERWGVTEFDFSIFDPDNFQDVSEILGNTPEEKIWYALISAGYSAYSAAGALGNMYGEASTFDPNTIEEGTGEGLGICQWSFTRRIALIEFAKSKGKEWNDLELQIEFLLEEIKPGGSMDIPGKYGTSRDKWANATSVKDATYQFEWWFERHREDLDGSIRYVKAEEYYNKYKNRTKDSFKSTSGDKGTLPTYYQTDYNNTYIGNVPISVGGCGPTSMAMVASALTGKTVTVVDECKWCENNGFYVNNQGTSHAYIQAAANHHGFKCKELGKGNIGSVVQALKENKYVISLQGPGRFTKGGHYIVLESITSNGKIKVKDPNKENNSNDKEFTQSEINEASKNYWALYK